MAAEKGRERLAAFLFRLARDEVTFGKIEEHVRVVEEAHPLGDPSKVIYRDTAAPLGEWARETAERLVG